ncbi:MAG: glycosyltransferase [archaeon]|nr:glycosyltransferase [archaeon]
MKVSIIMPAYNEEKRIESTLKAYSTYFKNNLKKEGLDYEILVAINNTTDRTEEIVKKISKSDKKIIYISLIKGGKGYAIIEGFKDALKRNNDLIGFVDADMATPPEAYHALIKGIKEHGGAIASRWTKGSVIKAKQTLRRRIMSTGFNALVRSMFLMPYRDTQCGAKLFKKEVIQAIVNEIGITDWAFDIDLIYKIRKKEFRIKEIPTIWYDKRDSKLNLNRVPFQMFAGISRIRLINSPFNFIVGAYDKLPESIKIHHN